MIADISLVALYALALLLCRSALALAALLITLMSVYVGSHANLFEPWLFHVVHAILFTMLVFSKERGVKLSAFSMVVFQYIMAWDAMLFPSVETVLYQSYPVVSAVIHLFIIYSVSKTWSGHAGNYNADCDTFAGRVYHL